MICLICFLEMTKPIPQVSLCSCFLSPINNIFFECFLLVSSLNDDVADILKRVSEVLCWKSNVKHTFIICCVWQFVIAYFIDIESTNYGHDKTSKSHIYNSNCPVWISTGIWIRYHAMFRNGYTIKTILSKVMEDSWAH